MNIILFLILIEIYFVETFIYVDVESKLDTEYMLVLYHPPTKKGSA